MSLSFDPNSLAGTLIIPAKKFKLHLWPGILSRGSQKGEQSLPGLPLIGCFSK